MVQDKVILYIRKSIFEEYIRRLERLKNKNEVITKQIAVAILKTTG